MTQEEVGPAARGPQERLDDHAAIDRLTDELLPALVAKLGASGLGELEVREGAWRVRLRMPAEGYANPGRRAASGRQGTRSTDGGHGEHLRSDATGAAGAGQATRARALGSSGTGHAATTGHGPEVAPIVGPSRVVATSPAVGYFRPRADLHAGTRVRAGDRIGGVDVLGIGQDVLAPGDGLIGATLVEAGEPVEYGQAVIVLEQLSDGRPQAADAGVADLARVAGLGPSRRRPSVAGRSAASDRRSRATRPARAARPATPARGPPRPLPPPRPPRRHCRRRAADAAHRGRLMFDRVLIANRGEIAVRILRACRTMGIGAVVAYSEADRDSLAAQLADEAICIGPADAKRSYLSPSALISAAIVTGCDAIHPGYGFLSEDGGFAEAVAAHGLTFIGPSAEVLERFASKEASRSLMARHGLPTIPGSDGMIRDDEHALSEAARVGYPILIKPSAGGGGKGMRMVRTPRELEASLRVCRSEARAAFGDDSLYLEKWLEDNRHVEVQVVVDRYGRGVHLGERDCSVQRRHQKIVEEAPTPALPPASRAELCERAIAAVVAAGYENIGTLEFLVDRDGGFYFIEINCRIQVEHPVTEMLTGIDLVATQIRIAAGEPLGFGQEDVEIRGHAFEFRINAEDAAHEFRPQAGLVERFYAPGGPGVRLDSHLYAGYDVPAVLRLAAGQARRLGGRPAGGDRPLQGRPRRARGGRHHHEPVLPPRAAGERGVRRGPGDHQPDRPRRDGGVPGPPELIRPVHTCIHPPARRLPGRATLTPCTGAPA